MMKTPTSKAKAATKIFATRLDEKLIEQIKLKAIRERRRVQGIVGDALAAYLQVTRKEAQR